MIETTINGQSRTYLSETELAKYIQKLIFPDEYMTQILNFFTDVPTQDIEKFAARYNIADQVIRTYYEMFIKDIYPNARLEEMIY